MRSHWIGYLVIILGLNYLLQNLGGPHVELGRIIHVLWPLALVWVGWDMVRDERRRAD